MNTKNVQKATMRKKITNSKNDYSNVTPLVKREVLGVGLTNATTEEVLEYLIKIITKTQKNLFVVTPNPEMLVLADSSEDFKTILNKAELALCDGMQLLNAARILGVPLKERIIGTNFVERVCEKVEDWPITVGFLGAGSGVAEQASECLKDRFPKLQVVFAEAEWEEAQSTKPIDILFVAFGFPKQEFWMANHINTIPVRVMIGVGGAFDQIVHPGLRPPAWMHDIGLGWLYRLVREPWRLGRQVKLVTFVGMVLKEKFIK